MHDRSDGFISIIGRKQIDDCPGKNPSCIVCMNPNQLSFGDCCGYDIFRNVSKLSVRSFHLKDLNFFRVSDGISLGDL